jgi:hypothetical protein
MERTEHLSFLTTLHERPTPSRCGGILVTALVLLLAVPPSAGAADPSADENLQQWQLRRLFVPTERELVHEREGNVYIYEGLTDRQVDQALDQNFDRIEYMLFLGTRRTDESGNPQKSVSGKFQTESAGCGN